MLKLQSREEFIDDYVVGYMRKHAATIQEMEEREAEQKMIELQEKADSLWGIFNKCVQARGKISHRSIAFYELFLEQGGSNDS